MNNKAEQELVDTLLRKQGIKVSITKLARDARLCARCMPTLLELMKPSFSLSMRVMIAEAFFAGGPDRSQKRKAVQFVLTVLRENDDQKSERRLCFRLASLLSGSTLVKGALVNNVEASQVHGIGTLVLDECYAQDVREQLTFALRKIGNADAIMYLRRGAADPRIAGYSLRALDFLHQPVAGLCAQALKLRGVAQRSKIEKIASKIQFWSAYDIEKAEANAWLQQRGVRHGIEDLSEHPRLSPGCVSHLCDLLTHPLSSHMLETVTRAVFAREPDLPHKRMAIDVLLKRIRKFRPKNTDDEPFLSDIITTELAGRIEAWRVHEIGRLMLDTRLGELRSSFSQVLFEIGDANAISYLRKGAKDSVSASLALNRLAQLRVEGTLELCAAALKDPDVLHKDVIKEMCSKLKRQTAGKRKTFLRVTKEPVPKGLKEWSAAGDATELARALRNIQKCVKEGFAKPEISEARSAADDLSVDQDVRLKFNVNFKGRQRPLWLEIFCDDENVFDLDVFGAPELIRKIEAEIGKLT